MIYKQPRSIQVVIFSPNAREYLLLRRTAYRGRFWQSVTGSLEAGETHKQAAVRELSEETGIAASEQELIDIGLTNTFEIAPEWRPFYSPEVRFNEEVCFALAVGRCEVRLDPREHDAYAWVDFATALAMLYWDSSKRAFAATESLLQLMHGSDGG